MKTKTNFLRIAVSGIVFVMVASLLGCGKKNTPSPAQVNTNILSSHGWMLQSLQVDNVDKTSLYTGMTLSFTATNYTTTKGAPVWVASGTWAFSGNDGKIITRDDQIDVSIDQIADSQLVLSLTWNKTTLGAGRQASVSGKHVYTLVK